MAPDHRRLAHEGTRGFGVGTGSPAGRGSGRRRRLPVGLILFLVVTAVAGGLLGMAISMGWIGPAGRALGRFLDFYCGVFALVTLSLAVMIGLLATDRTILSPKRRVHAQAVHRAVAFLSVSMLVAHLITQLARHRVGMVQAFVPFSASLTYAVGTVAFYLLVVAIASGIARGRFAPTGRPWVWRLLHLTAYVAWPMGIWHGLSAGRDAPPFVKAAYALCLAAVVLALIARPFLRPRAGRTA
ncbi:hypothetical protein ACGFNU_43685 [Spirillospora sp. NPDC048911]|uniref:hypothetical protein n=1 Tax=Spirillospora sp. NPDC048911 TaxID=3364527 RepID=UPI003712052B